MFNENTIVGKRMNLLVTIFTIVLILFVASMTVNSFSGRGYAHGGALSEDQNTISVSGKGEIIAIPDIVTVTFSVVEQADTVVDAQNKSTTKMNTALSVLKAQGVENKDIKTTDYNAYPRYEYQNQICTQYSCPPSGNQKIIGYEVSLSVAVKIRKIEDAGKILGAIGETGVSNISGLNFEVDNQDVKTREARKLAIDDARTQAKQLANDLGVRLGDIMSFNESGNYPIPMMYRTSTMEMGGTADSTLQLPLGESKITSNVTIIYEIK